MSEKGGGLVDNRGKKLKKQYTKRHPGLGWFFGIPDFKISNGFTYAIESLKNTEMSNAISNSINNKKKKLAEDAENTLNSVVQSLRDIESNNAAIRNALDFLKRAANSERRKEILVLKEYQDKIKSSLPEKEQKKVLKAIQSAEEIDLDKNFDFSVYSDLVLSINYLRNGYQQTLQRLQNLQSHKKTDQTLKDYLTEKKTAGNKETDKLFQDIYKDSIGFIGEQNILSLLGEASSSGRHSKSVFSQNFRNAIKKYIFSPEILAKFNNRGGNGIVTRGQLQGALLASIGTDILQVLQEQLNAQQKKDFVQLENIDQIVDEYFQNYRDSKNLTRFQRALLEDSTELQKILDNAIRTFGIEEIEEDKELQRRARQIKYRDTTYDSKDKNSFLNILKSTGNESLLKKFRGLRFNVTTKTSHGNFDEFLQQFVSQSIEDKSFQSRGGQAIDEYALGSVTCYLENIDDFINYINAIDTAVIQARSFARKTVENDQTERLKNMNIAMQKAEEILMQKIKQIDTLDSETKNVFIYHESFKLSKSAEVGLRGPFKGREMAILNYIDTLYTIPSDIFTPPDKKNLYFLALNLADAAGGKTTDAREALRYYLSIFAGLIMFEDVERIASDINASLLTSGVKNIHLYKLNGIYVPSSMILSYTYTQMKAIYKIAEQGNKTPRGFNASITIDSKKANNAITEVVNWTKTRKYPKDGKAYSYHWYELANDVASGTKIRVAFLSSFLKLIEKLTEGFID